MEDPIINIKQAIRQLAECGVNTSELMSATLKAADMFREINESEDERIRSALIRGFNSMLANQSIGTFYGEPIKDIISYLEKQKAQKSDDVKREWWNKGYLEGRKNAHIPARELGLPSSLDFQQKPNIELIQCSWYMEGYHDGEFSREPKWIIKTGEGGPKYEKNEKYGQPLEQKSVVWSRGDKKIMNALVDYIGSSHALGIDLQMAKCWLKDLPKRIRPSWKPSNLELGALRTAISVLTEERNFQRAGKHLQDILDHFEGKETRHDWKPSEEQMDELYKMICECRPADQQLLQDIYYGLKKLM